ncbi:unnamed protein product [Ostreobium quekettii]|uniref:Uncharacterized protein n=1 Tax=Ostreobium quekettii TaxID=121088 RepID=A0A8S1IQW4_9CHLO|nr:unnamed protein product [Ostreobium quekettii]
MQGWGLVEYSRAQDKTCSSENLHKFSRMSLCSMLLLSRAQHIVTTPVNDWIERPFHGCALLWFCVPELWPLVAAECCLAEMLCAHITCPCRRVHTFARNCVHHTTVLPNCKPAARPNITSVVHWGPMDRPPPARWAIPQNRANA